VGKLARLVSEWSTLSLPELEEKIARKIGEAVAPPPLVVAERGTIRARWVLESDELPSRFIVLEYVAVVGPDGEIKEWILGARMLELSGDFLREALRLVAERYPELWTAVRDFLEHSKRLRALELDLRDFMMLQRGFLVLESSSPDYEKRIVEELRDIFAKYVSSEEAEKLARAFYEAVRDLLSDMLRTAAGLTLRELAERTTAALRDLLKSIHKVLAGGERILI